MSATAIQTIGDHELESQLRVLRSIPTLIAVVESSFSDAMSKRYLCTWPRDAIQHCSSVRHLA